MELEKLAQELRNNAELTDVSGSPAGKAVASRLDEASLRDALGRGDAKTLQQLLSQVLSTPEGKALAEQVKKAVEHK